MWLLARLAPDHKTIADFRKDNGPGIKVRHATDGGSVPGTLHVIRAS
jgi:hypothetical protein